jgi:hypothetical protein
MICIVQQRARIQRNGVKRNIKCTGFIFEFVISKLEKNDNRFLKQFRSIQALVFVA